jgi:hypothetical protein
LPTYERDARFRREYRRLSADQRAAFRLAVRKLVADLRTGTFRKGLRVKTVVGQDGVWEMTWAPDGRATFRYGAPIRSGEPHVIWLRIGSHDIF